MPASSNLRLTKTVVDSAQASGKRYMLWDSELAGFAVRIEASGTKSFVIRYRAEGGGRTAPSKPRSSGLR